MTRTNLKGDNMTREYSEQEVRNDLFRTLHADLSRVGSSPLEERVTRFTLAPHLGQGECVIEGSLSYSLLSGATLPHKSDILISLSTGMHLSLELKFLSAVTDQFKTRSYDMLHLKRTYGHS